ncbi:hypothetical protein AMTRI_Chr09g18550 [Amborella trichopoda]
MKAEEERKNSRQLLTTTSREADAVFKTHPMNVLNKMTLKGPFFGNYKLHSDLRYIVDKYMKKVHVTWRTSSHIQSHSQRTIKLFNTCSKGTAFAALLE